MALGMHIKEAKGRVLVIDDEAEVRKIVRFALEKSGYDVVEAEDGEKAINEIRSGDNPLLTDVIICDVRMPKINGIEAVSFFREQFPSVPIVVLTGYPDMQLATSFLKQGVMEYLVKPVEKEKLIETVEKAMMSRGSSGDSFKT
tara:strand:- start:11776 stop:12207 length:432 start_codon:yes stop_codon:yes gene_type:complete